MLRKALTSAKRGQAMVESIIAMVAVLFAFLALFSLSDLIRSRLLAEGAASKCARARAVGYNDFMLRKIARLATMPAAGECLSSADGGGSLPQYARISRIGDYLASDYEEQADAILDFELWQYGKTAVSASEGTSLSDAQVVQRRPVDPSMFALYGIPAEDGEAAVSAKASTETHYTEYLQ